MRPGVSWLFPFCHHTDGIKLLYSAAAPAIKQPKQHLHDASCPTTRGHCSHLRAFLVLPRVRPSSVKSCEHLPLRFPCRGCAPPANRCHALHLGGNCNRRRRKGKVRATQVHPPSFCTLPQAVCTRGFTPRSLSHDSGRFRWVCADFPSEALFLEARSSKREFHEGRAGNLTTSAQSWLQMR